MRQDRESAVKVIFVGWVKKLGLFFRYRFFFISNHTTQNGFPCHRSVFQGKAFTFVKNTKRKEKLLSLEKGYLFNAFNNCLPSNTLVLFQ